MTTIGASTEVGRPRRARAGAWSLIAALVALLWATLTIVLALASSATGGSTGPIAYGMFFIGFLVVPAGFIASLVLAVIAFITNRVLGKVLAGIALALVIVMGVVVYTGMMGSSGMIFGG